MIEKSRLGPFVLEQRLGNQRSGSVYHAIHLQRRRAMAVRIMSQHLGNSGTAVPEFAREVEFLKTLEHPNVVRVFGGGVFDDEAYLAMELVKGESLEELLRRNGRLPWETVIDYATQACSGLEYAHHRGTIHQNLTTAKLLLTEDGKIKITDFRGSRLNEYDRWNDCEPRPSCVAYLAPEQLREGGAVTHKTDLYALGCIMYELLTGERPFGGPTVAELREQHLNDTPPRISSVVFNCPIWLETLVAQMLEKDPNRRPHFASAVMVALEEVKEKALAGAGIVEHVAGGAASALKAPEAHSEVRRLLKRKSPAKPKHHWVPFYERAWFLAACAVFVVGLVTWAFWPASEAELFAEAETLMASEDRADWQQARDLYLEPMLERFPDGQFAGQAKEYLDRIDMKQAEVRMENNLRLGRTPRQEGERRYAEALGHEQEGDYQLAAEEYRLLLADFSADGPDRPYVLLARRQLKLVEDRLAAAQAAQQADQALAADANPLEATVPNAAALDQPATVADAPPTAVPDEQFEPSVPQAASPSEPLSSVVPLKEPVVDLPPETASTP